MNQILVININFIFSDETMRYYMKRRQELLDLEAKMHFSYDLEATLSEDERLVD